MVQASTLVPNYKLVDILLPLAQAKHLRQQSLLIIPPTVRQNNAFVVLIYSSAVA